MSNLGAIRAGQLAAGILLEPMHLAGYGPSCVGSYVWAGPEPTITVHVSVCMEEKSK